MRKVGKLDSYGPEMSGLRQRLFQLLLQVCTALYIILYKVGSSLSVTKGKP